MNAVGTGVEPVRACAHEFSRLAHYRPAHPPYAEDEGVEPTDHLRGQGLANLCLSRSAYPPARHIISASSSGTKREIAV